MSHKKVEQDVKRRPEIAVGDMIQYRYSYGTAGTTSSALTTNEVVEVIDSGAKFQVEGGFHVFARQITLHIPMEGSGWVATKEQL